MAIISFEMAENVDGACWLISQSNSTTLISVQEI